MSKASTTWALVLLAFHAGCRSDPSPEFEGEKVVEIKNLIDIPENRSWMLNFSWDGRYLGVPRVDGAVELWDLRTREVRSFQSERSGPETSAISIAFSKNGRFLAVHDSEKRATIWDIDTHQEIAHLSIPWDCFIKAMAFAEEDRTLVTILARNEYQSRQEEKPTPWKWSAILWDMETGAERARHVIPEDYRFRILSSDGRYALLDKYPQTTILDVLDGSEVCTLPTSGQDVFSDDGSSLVCVSTNGDWVEVWDIPSGKRIHRFDIAPPLEGSSRVLAVSPDIRLLARNGGSSEMYLISLESGKVLARFECAPSDEYSNLLRFSPDGKILVTDTDGVNANDQDVPRRLRFWKVPDFPEEAKETGTVNENR